VGGKLLIWNKGHNDLCVVYAGECGMLHVCMGCWCVHTDVVKVCAVIGETLRMLGNIGVQEVGSVREVFLYLCWGAVGVWSE